MFNHYNTPDAAESYLTGLGYLETAIGMWTGPAGQRVAVTPGRAGLVRIEVLA